MQVSRSSVVTCFPHAGGGGHDAVGRAGGWIKQVTGTVKQKTSARGRLKIWVRIESVGCFSRLFLKKQIGPLCFLGPQNREVS